jgi:hypothetical protein
VITWFPNLATFPNGVTLSSNTALFTIRFTVVGAGTATVNVANVPPGIEVVNSAGAPVTVSFSGGASTVIGSGAPPPPGSCAGNGNPPAATTYSGFKVIAGQAHLAQNQRSCMPITVNAFTNILTSTFAIQWDDTKFQYDCVRNVNTSLPGLSTSLFQSDSKTLRVGWDDPAVTGKSLPDGAKLFDLCFIAIGAPASINLPTIGSNGLQQGSNAEVVNSSGTDLWSVNAPVRDTLFIIDPANPGCGITFKASQINVEQGQQGCVDIRADKMFWATNAEFVITFDQTKLTYQSINLGANPLSLSTGANFNTTSPGQVRFNWSNFTPTSGTTLADNTTLFSVCFTNTMAPGGVTPVNIASVACTPMSCGRKNIGQVPLLVSAGQITSLGPTNGVTASATNPNCSGGTATLTATPTAGTPLSYAWTGPNGYTSNLQNPTNATVGGTYTVVATFTGGATASSTTQVTIPTAINIDPLNNVIQNVNCNGGSNGSITVTPTGGTSPYAYNWASSVLPFTSTNAASIINLKSATYTVTVTDNKGCTFVSLPIVVTQPQVLSINTAQTVVTNVKCTGESNGSVSLNISGGSPMYLVGWTFSNGPFNQTGANISNLAAGNYTATVTDSRGCTTVNSFTVAAPSTPLIVNQGTIDPVNCFNGADGCINISTTGGWPGTATFVWKNTANNITVGTTQNICGLAAGSYNVTVTDAGGCSKSLASAAVVTGPSSPLTVNVTATPTSCPNSNNGSITVSANGGWGGPTYVWTPVLPGIPVVNGVSKGTYTVAVTDAGGCTVTAVATVGGPADFSIGNPQVTNLTCSNSGNGSINIQPSGGNPGVLAVSWSGTPLVGATISNLPAGTYTPILSDGSGCSQVFAAITVSAPQPIMLSAATVNQSGVTNNGSIDLTPTGGNPGNYTYSWTGPNGFISSLQDPSGLATGTYTVTVQDVNLCSAVGTYTVGQDNVVAPIVLDSIKGSCSDNGCIYFHVAASASTFTPLTIAWSGAQSGTSTSNNTTLSICDLKPGNYNITVTASNGNSSVLSGVVPQLDPANVNTSSTPPFDDFKNGSITLTPQFPSMSYIWNYQGSTSAALSNLDSGLYVVTVTNNASGCTKVYTFDLDRQYLPYSCSTATKVDPTCKTSANGSLGVLASGGNGPNYTYQWVGPNGVLPFVTPTITGLTQGIYTCTIRDESGTACVQTNTLVSQSQLAITNVNELSNCNGWQVCGENSCDGIANVVYTGQNGAVNILWSNGATSSQTNTLCGGAYGVTVTDGLGCTSVWSDELTAPPSIQPLYEVFKPKCAGDCNGSARLNVAGGVIPYTVKWSTGQQDVLFNSTSFSQAINLCPGNYTVTVTDDNDITKVITFELQDAPPLIIEFSAVEPTTFNSCDGEILAFTNGAALPVVMNWSGNYGHSGQGARAEGLCAGELVQYVVQDANGCTAIDTTSVPYPPDGCLQVRPVLTPSQQDGNNDFMFISCIESVQNKVEVYNRWGQLVFETENYDNASNNFKGLTRSGQALAEGVYYYVLSFTDDDGNFRQEKGHINLLK